MFIETCSIASIWRLKQLIILQVFEENMKGKHEQVQQLKESLRRLIEEHPDSPEAEKWKHMLAQIGMHQPHPKALIYFYLCHGLTRCKSVHLSPALTRVKAYVRGGVGPPPRTLNQC